MRLKYKILVLLTPIIFILDQLTKFLIVSELEIGERIQVIPNFFDIVHFRNTGAAFGMFAGMMPGFRVPFFYAMATVVTILLAFFYRSLGDREKLMPVAISLVFAGIAGNILDRFRMGSVVDFLSLHIGDHVLKFNLFGRHVSIALEWPAFNVADSAITVAMFLLLYSVLFQKRAGGRKI